MKVLRIVVAITVLHNICILTRAPGYADDAPALIKNNVHGDPADDDNYAHILDEGRQVRNVVVQYLEEF